MYDTLASYTHRTVEPLAATQHRGSIEGHKRTSKANSERAFVHSESAAPRSRCVRKGRWPDNAQNRATRRRTSPRKSTRVCASPRPSAIPGRSPSSSSDLPLVVFRWLERVVNLHLGRGRPGIEQAKAVKRIPAEMPAAGGAHDLGCGRSSPKGVPDLREPRGACSTYFRNVRGRTGATEEDPPTLDHPSPPARRRLRKACIAFRSVL